MPIAVQWWAVWYPGAEPGGGSYIAQRMLASKSEKDALGGTLFFNVAHYVLRPWPWILVGLASLIVYPQLSDIQKAFPNLDPKLIGHDIAFPAMLRFLPAGWMGLMLGGLIAANSSTILTHLNWGASYLVHDFYRRFINHGRHREALRDGGARARRCCCSSLSSAMVFALDTAQDSFNIILQIGAGTGLLYLLRWFWWRVTAWCEIVAMVSSFLVVAWCFLVLTKNGVELGTAAAAAHHASRSPPSAGSRRPTSGPQTDPAVLVNFYRKVRPFGPGWGPVQRARRSSAAEAAETGENFPLALRRLAERLHHDLVGAVYGRQFPVRPDGLRARAAGGISLISGIDRHPGGPKALEVG